MERPPYFTVVVAAGSSPHARVKRQVVELLLYWL